MSDRAPETTGNDAGLATPWPWLLALAAVTALAYWPSLGNGITNWDDTGYVTQNPIFGSWSAETIGLAFSGYFKGNYHPLTLLSLSLDHNLGGGDVRVHHVVNLLLHVANTCLVALVVLQLVGRRWIAVGVGALFGLHPMHVESVAWISARKDVLSAFFFLLSLLAYLRYLRSLPHDRGPADGRATADAPSSGQDTPRSGLWYAAALTLFLLALLSKGTAVALAPVLVLVDALRGRELLGMRSVLEKAPFFGLALLFGVVALGAQASVGQLEGVSEWTFTERLALGAYGFLRYLWLLAAPVGLSAFYPYPDPVDGGLPAAYYAFLPAAIGLLALFVAALRRWPLLAFGIAFYAVNVAFVLQLIPVGGAVIADRYTYLPSIGVFLAWAWAGQQLAARWPAAVRPALALAVAYLALLAALTWQRCEIWRDSLTLWNDTLARAPGFAQGHLNRALARYEVGDLDGAVADLDESIRLAPGYALAWSHRGVLRHMRGEHEAALHDLDRAIVLSPSADIFANRGAVRLVMGNPEGALTDLDRAIALNPSDLLAWANRGRARVELGQHRAALEDLNAVLSVAPGLVPAHVSRARALLGLGEPGYALADADTVLDLEPDQPEALRLRGEALLDLGRHAEACDALQRAEAVGATEAATLVDRHCLP